MSENILFDVKKWPAFMYKQERKTQKGIRQAENKGADKSTRWGKVMEEGFSNLLDPQTKRLDEPPKPGFEVEQTALENMTAMQEFKALQEFTRGDEYASGQAITTLAKAVADKLTKVLGNQEQFGSRKGLRVKKLRKYHYMFGMEYFDDTNMHELAQYPNHKAALSTVEKNLKSSLGGVTQVYRIDIPGKDEVVFGVGMKKPKGGDKYMDDSYIMGIIDFTDKKGTAHLPYEILVSDKRVYHLYARFRIAINFPDLSMMGDNSFMNIVESPEALKKVLTRVAGGEVSDSYWD